MAFNFPAGPTNGQTYSLNGTSYVYNSTLGAWLTTSVFTSFGNSYATVNAAFSVANTALQNTTTTLNGTLTTTTGVLAIGGGISSNATAGSFNAYDRNLGGSVGVFYRSGGVNRLYDNAVGDVITYNTSGNTAIGVNYYSYNYKLDVNGTMNVSTTMYVQQNQSNYFTLKDIQYFRGGYNCMFMVVNKIGRAHV